MSDFRELLQTLRNFEKENFKNHMTVVIKNYEPREIIDKIFIPGLDETRNRYHRGEIAIPEFLLSMRLLMDILSHPDIKKTRSERPNNKIVLGVIEGDPHDLGKNIVKKIYECYGFQVYDLGKNVLIHNFADKARETEADIVAISTMMSTTVGKVSQAIELAKTKTPYIKVIVGGAFMTNSVANSIGADGYAESAAVLIEETDNILSKAKQIGCSTGN